MSSLLRYRMVLGFFIFALIMSGITAFPLLTELRLLCHWFGLDLVRNPQELSGIEYWILTVKLGLEATYSNYPWLAYGTDWLAFGHIVISLFFVIPWLKPANNAPILWVGVIACLLVIPLALICGEVRGIPFYWRLIDCSFGIVGIFPLLYCLKQIKVMEQEESRDAL